MDTNETALTVVPKKSFAVAFDQERLDAFAVMMNAVMKDLSIHLWMVAMLEKGGLNDAFTSLLSEMADLQHANGMCQDEHCEAHKP